MSVLPSNGQIPDILTLNRSIPLNSAVPNFDITSGVAFSNRIGNNPAHQDTGVLDVSKKYLGSFFNPQSESTEGKTMSPNTRGDKVLLGFNAYTNNTNATYEEDKEELSFGKIAGLGALGLFGVLGIYLLTR